MVLKIVPEALWLVEVRDRDPDSSVGMTGIYESRELAEKAFCESWFKDCYMGFHPGMTEEEWIACDGADDVEQLRQLEREGFEFAWAYTHEHTDYIARIRLLTLNESDRDEAEVDCIAEPEVEKW